MKKLIAIILSLCAAVAVTMTACSENGADTPQTSGTPEASDTPESVNDGENTADESKTTEEEGRIVDKVLDYEIDPA